MSKKYDLSVKVGEYQSNGQTKAKYENVGVMMEKDGKPYILFKRTFNPAAVGDSSKDSILISMFEPRADKPAAEAKAAGGVVNEDHIPF